MVSQTLGNGYFQSFVYSIAFKFKISHGTLKNDSTTLTVYTPS